MYRLCLLVMVMLCAAALQLIHGDLSYEQQCEDLTYTRFNKQSDIFKRKLPDRQYPTQENLLETFVRSGKVSKNEAVAYAQGVAVLYTWPVLRLAEEYLAAMEAASQDSPHVARDEQNFYIALRDGKGATPFLQRIIRDRPLMFYSGQDKTLVMKNALRVPDDQWTTVQRDPALLKHYMSYPEIRLSALLGMSADVRFINNGGRFNRGVAAGKDASGADEFEEHGVLVGVVGPRFEKLDQNEAAYMVLSKDFSTCENGFGKDCLGNMDPHLRVFVNALKLSYVPSFEEAKSDCDAGIDILKHKQIVAMERGYPHPKEQVFLFVPAYKQRLQWTFIVLLLEAQRRAVAVPGGQKRAYVVVPGFGLGGWAVNTELQRPHFLAAFAESLARLVGAGLLGNIEAVDLFGVVDSEKQLNELPEQLKLMPSGIKLRWSTFNKDNGAEDNGKDVPGLVYRLPSSKLRGEFADMLLVEGFAWDGNAFVGNEYWDGKLTQSGDPAAVASCTAPEIMNPHVNPCALSLRNFICLDCKDGAQEGSKLDEL